MASTYLSKTFSSSPTSAKIFTISCWIKKSSNGSDNCIYGKDGSTDSASQIYFNTSDQLRFFDNTSGTDMDLLTNRLFRDVSAWYHIVWSVDSTQGTASNRVKLYVNGVQETSFATSNYPDNNASFVSTDNGKDTFVGVTENTSGTKFGYLNGSLAHYHFIDGTAYDADTFGETDATTGIWKPKTAPSVTYGTNGFFLKFENSGAFGTDSSGNSNTFTVNGTMTQTIDTPSNVFATANPLDYSGTAPTLGNGNLSITSAELSDKPFRTTIAVSQGKWYMEYKCEKSGSDNDNHIGIWSADNSLTSNYVGYQLYSWGIFTGTGYKRNNQSYDSYGSAIVQNDIVMIALDKDNGKIWWGKNGTWFNSGDPASGTNEAFSNINTVVGSDGFVSFCFLPQQKFSLNFGNGYFGTTAVASAGTSTSGDDSIWEYDCPSGYYGLNTKNINEQEYS